MCLPRNYGDRSPGGFVSYIDLLRMRREYDITEAIYELLSDARLCDTPYRNDDLQCLSGFRNTVLRNHTCNACLVIEFCSFGNVFLSGGGQKYSIFPWSMI